MGELLQGLAFDSQASLALWSFWTAAPRKLQFHFDFWSRCAHSRVELCLQFLMGNCCNVKVEHLSPCPKNDPSIVVHVYCILMCIRPRNHESRSPACDFDIATIFQANSKVGQRMNPPREKEWVWGLGYAKICKGTEIKALTCYNNVEGIQLKAHSVWDDFGYFKLPSNTRQTALAQRNWHVTTWGSLNAVEGYILVRFHSILLSKRLKNACASQSRKPKHRAPEFSSHGLTNWNAWDRDWTVKILSGQSQLFHKPKFEDFQDNKPKEVVELNANQSWTSPKQINQWYATLRHDPVLQVCVQCSGPSGHL